MLLGFLKRRKCVSADAFARTLWDFCIDVSGQFDAEFRTLIAMTGRELSQEQKNELFREILIAGLWAISNVLREQRNVLDSLHQIAISAHHDPLNQKKEQTQTRSLSQRELIERYQKYYGAWNPNSGDPPFALASIMLDHMLNHGQHSNESLDAMLMHVVLSHTLEIMKDVLDLRNGFDVAN